MAAFGKSQGGTETSTATTFDEIESPTPTTGFDDAPAGELSDFGPGVGIGNTRKGIH